MYCDSTSVFITRDAATNTLILTGLFSTFQNAPGPLTLQLIGNTNPPTTARQYFTLTTYNQDGTIYKIDESSDLFYLDFQTGDITVTLFYPLD